MKILVTGGTGYIGSHTCIELLLAGHELVVVDNFSNSTPSMVKNIEELSGKKYSFYENDIRDIDALRRIFSDHKIDAVIHFAGLKAVGESVKKPLKYYENNIGGGMTLFRVMNEFDCTKIVFSSSATVYGMNNPVPYQEHFQTSAINPYGETKLMQEQMLMDIAAADPRWSVSLLRYFNPIGAHESGLIGEEPKGIPNNLLPYIMQVATGGLKELSVYGNDYPTPDGTGVRDYIHVMDLARGHVVAVNYIAEHTGCQAVNLGTGRGTSVLEIVTAFERASGRQVPYKIAPRRDGDLACYYADTKKARELLGWTASYDIEKMCKDSWHFAEKRYLSN